MADVSDDRIARRARELWELAGYPDGRDDEFWLQAEGEVKGEADSYAKIKNDPTTETNS
jgi:hypothetical protein